MFRILKKFVSIVVLWIIITTQIAFYPVSAASSTWTQTDWFGGSGQTSWAESNKFSSNSNINFSTTGQLTIGTRWYNASWLYRKKITFDNAAQAENLTNFPLLVKLNSSKIDYSKTQNAGQDIRFTDSDGTTLLAYEIEKWDESGNSFVWVKVPQIDAFSSSDHIYIYYGNSMVTDGQNATNVWTADFKGVWHLNETDPSTQSAIDSTTNANNGTNYNMSSSTDQTGIIGSSYNLDGDDVSNIDLHSPGFPGSQNFSVSLWIKPSGSNNAYGMPLAGPDGSYYFMILNTGSQEMYFVVQPPEGEQYSGTTSVNPYDGQWHHLVGVRNGGNVYFYIDGVLRYSRTVPVTALSTGSSFLIGRHPNWWSSLKYLGYVDQVEISQGARSASWVAASYKSESDIFNTYGPEESPNISSGSLTSSIFDAIRSSMLPEWGTLTYTTTTPINTTVAVIVRTSNSATMESAPDFSTCPAIPSGSSLTSSSCVSSSHRYVQYQITLANSDTVSTPTFEEISIGFTNPPAVFTLDSPPHNAYTNGDRPSLSWKPATDTSGLSLYTVEIDNGDTGDFTIAEIPPIRNEKMYVTPRYTAHYDNFSDDDKTNNKVSVSTKSSNDWGSADHDGALKEGKRTWRVKSHDTEGNERTLTRTLFVDRTPPQLTINKINDRHYTNNISTSDTTPTVYGTVTDQLAGDKTENKVASGPKELKVMIEKMNSNGTYQSYKTDVYPIRETYFTSNNKKILDNSQQISDKYSSFIYTPSQPLPYGKYKVTVTATDIAGNTKTSDPTILSITTVSQITTPQEQLIIKQETQSLKPQDQQKIMQELEITKSTKQLLTNIPLPTTPPSLPQSKDKAAPSFFDAISSFFLNFLK